MNPKRGRSWAPGRLPGRPLALVRIAVLATIGAVAAFAQPVEHRVVIVAYDTNDVRLPMALDAIAFWNDVLADLELPVRLLEDVRIAPPTTRALENYARSISQRAGRLRSGPGEPDAPLEVTALGVEAVVLLSRQDLMSFAWPLPRRPGHFVAIEEDRTAMATNPNIARNIIAHEIGHTLGLRHNRDPTTLMCGPCRTDDLAADRPEYMRLTENDRRRLVERYAAPGNLRARSLRRRNLTAKLPTRPLGRASAAKLVTRLRDWPQPHPDSRGGLVGRRFPGEPALGL